MKKKNIFHIIKRKEAASEEIVEDMIEDLHEYHDPMAEIKQKIRAHRLRFWRRVLIVILILAALATGVWLFLKYQTYENITVTALYEHKKVDSSRYTEYAGGILKYSRDGVSYLNHEGVEIWNQPCQMQNPTVDICKGTLAIGDRGGTSILVFQKDGLKGEIQTTSPIQKLTVSGQGIVGVVLKNESAQKVICYDSKGNILVEHDTSLINTGYPLDLAISNNGENLLVSYLYTKGNVPVTKTVYYNFGEAGEMQADHQLAEAEYEDTVIPTVAFLNDKHSVLIGDDVLVFNSGLEKVQEVKRIEVKKQIKSVAYDQSGVALVLKKSGTEGYELRIYDTKGEQVVSTDFEGEYKNIKMTKNQVILFEGERCCIFNRSGICKYEGKMDRDIMEIFPVSGLNKYIVISADGLRKVRLAK